MNEPNRELNPWVDVAIAALVGLFSTLLVTLGLEYVFDLGEPKSFALAVVIVYVASLVRGSA